MRKYLYYTFLLAFLTITPLLIFYSLGYSFSNGFKLEKSGILIIATEPKGAKITIGEKTVEKLWSKILNKKEYVLTPTKIKNLKPGEYDIKVEFDGYWPWGKKLTIHSGQTTFAEDIYLFRNDVSALVNESENGISTLNESYFLNISAISATLINLKNQEKTLYLPDNDTILTKQIEWSTNKKKVLTDSKIFTLNDWENPLDIKNVLGDNFSKISWEFGSDKQILYANNDKLFTFNIENGNNRELFNNISLKNYLSKYDNIFLLTDLGNEIALQKWNSSSETSTTLINLPFSDYAFENTNHNLLNIKDTNHNILYLINPNSNINPLTDSIHNCTYTNWVTPNKLLYSNQNEIWLYDILNREEKLLTRISEKINNIAWHPSNNYIIFSTNESINILELDNREKHSITKIVEIPNIASMYLDEKGETIYYEVVENNKKSLYKKFIQ